jgi:hypothetical protein
MQGNRDQGEEEPLERTPMFAYQFQIMKGYVGLVMKQSFVPHFKAASI